MSARSALSRHAREAPGSTYRDVLRVDAIERARELCPCSERLTQSIITAVDQLVPPASGLYMPTSVPSGCSCEGAKVARLLSALAGYVRALRDEDGAS